MHRPVNEGGRETRGRHRIPLGGLIRLASFAVAMFLPLTHAATLVSGIASVNGNAQVTNTTIQFFDNNNDPNTLSGAASGSTQSYVTLNGHADPAMEIQELTGGPFSGALPGPGYVDYATFNVTDAPGQVIDFDLTNINQGVGTAGACFADTVGNVCTPLIDTTAAGDPWVASCPGGHTCVVSPFTLVQVSGGVNIFFVFDGLAYYAPPGPPAGANSSYTIGNLSTQGVVASYGGIVEIDNALHSGSGIVTASVSGTFGSTAVPEPATAFLALGGLLIGTGLTRRLKKKFRS